MPNNREDIIWPQIDLKPCPHCGQTKARLTDCLAVQCCEEWERCSDAGMIAVFCDFAIGGCGASGGFRETCEAAAEAWNQRA